MKKIYAKLVNKRLEFIKVIILILLLCNVNRSTRFFTSCLAARYSALSIDYMLRLFSMTEIILLTCFIVIRLSGFLKRNLESLLLLGLSNGQILLEFLWTTGDMLLLQAILGGLTAEYYGIGFSRYCLSNFISAAAVISISIILYQAIQKHRNVIILMMAAMAAGVAGLGTISYQTMYEILMSEKADWWYRSLYLDITAIKLLFTVILMIAAAFVCVYNGFQAQVKRHHIWCSDRLGDFIHKSGKLCASRKNYFWMYRSLDFIFWKVCSTFFLLLCCWMVESNAAIVCATYGICLVTSFYLRDIYEFERGNRLIYAMSAYTYKNLLKDHFINGVTLCQDSIFPILLLRCIYRTDGFVVLGAVLILNIAVSIFINIHLYADYPQKQSIGTVFLIMLRIHIPFFNMMMLYQSYRHGREHWNQSDYG